MHACRANSYEYISPIQVQNDQSSRNMNSFCELQTTNSALSSTTEDADSSDRQIDLQQNVCYASTTNRDVFEE